MISDKDAAQTWEALRDPEYRHQLVEEEINVGLAFQIRAIRNKQNLTQGDLSRKLKVRQPLVSAWENSSYGKYSLKTLKELARAFDVALSVRFIPFSTFVNTTGNLTKDDIAPPDFSEEVNRQMHRSGKYGQAALSVDANTPLYTNNDLITSGARSPFRVMDANLPLSGTIQSGTAAVPGKYDSGATV